MLVLTNREMRDIDRYTIEQIGIPSMILMEHAGKSVADWLKVHYQDYIRVGVVCGKGNNGGDGFVAARHLIQKQIDVTVYIVDPPEEFTNDSRVQFNIICNIGATIETLYAASQEQQEQFFRRHQLLIDAMLGTGGSGELRPAYLAAVKAINQIRYEDDRRVVISLDLPTGIVGDNGEVMDDAVRADRTLTFGYWKQSLITFPACQYAGQVDVIDIGIPIAAESNFCFEKQMLTEDMIYQWLPKRLAHSHKGTYGVVRCVAGSSNYFGAGLLAATACLHIGAGLVFWDGPQEIQSIWNGQTPELIFQGHSSVQGHFATDSVKSLSKAAEKADAVVLGCGITRFDSGSEWLLALLDAIKAPIVIDADAFVMLKDHLGALRNRQQATIVTPHPGELAQVIGISVDELARRRFPLARQFAIDYQVTLVLKGTHTLIVTPEGKMYINTTGSHVLAKGGSGDVLAGFIGGLIAQKVSPQAAACVAVYCHGRAAEQLAISHFVATMASDVSRSIGAILRNIATRA